MKWSKAKILATLALIIGGIGTLISEKSDEMAMDEMKAELKNEILNDLQKRDS